MERLPGLAEELVRLQPDIILAPATTPALVAKQATLTIPIVCPLLENPVGLGLVASHNRPGGNVTGLLRYVDGLAGKTLMLATQLLPGASRIGMLVNVGSAESIDQRRDMTAAAQKLPLKIVPPKSASLMTWKPHSRRLQGSVRTPWSCCRIRCSSASTDGFWHWRRRRFW
jgi:putative ABC transport system substrate-binding protein